MKIQYNNFYPIKHLSIRVPWHDNKWNGCICSKEHPYAKFNNQGLDFTKNWIQDYENQKALFNCFFEHVKTEESLAFIYAKEIPFVENHDRIVVGFHKSRMREICTYGLTEGKGSKVTWYVDI